jgi:hypothetical protein
MHVLKSAALAAATLVSGAAVAQASPWYIGLSQSFNHQSNMLRAIDGTVLAPDQSKSDTLSTTALIGGLDQAIGRQRLSANASLRNERYAKNDLYDNQGWTASAALDWQTVNRLSGNLSLSSSRSLASFNLQEIGLVRQRNQETGTSVDTSVRMGIAGPWSLEASLGRRKVDNSLEQAALQSRNYRQDTGSLGVGWRPSGLLSLRLGLRQTDGRYPQFQTRADGTFQADRFRREDVDLFVGWRPSGPSQLDLRISSGKTRYDLAQQRDFTGVTGSFSWNWVPSGKLAINTRYTRDTGQDSYSVTVFDRNLGFVPGTSDYSRVQDLLRIRADWAASAKIGVSASITEANRKLVRTLPPNVFSRSITTGGERNTQTSLGARWAPHRSALVGCDLTSERRRGNGDLGTNLSTEGLSCYGQFTFQ